MARQAVPAMGSPIDVWASVGSGWVTSLRTTPRWWTSDIQAREAYLQDTIKLKPRLTGMIGLRWDPQFGVSHCSQ